MTLRSLFRSALSCGLVVLAASVATRAQQTPQQPAPTGPLAPEKYKDIQVLKDVPADQLDLTMRYFVASTSLQCQSCHVRDQATGEFAYEQDTRNKTTARQMIQLVQTVNAGEFGARINCGTCHQGRSQPAGLQPAQVMTAEQIAQAAAFAARQGGPGGPGGPGGARGAQPGRGGAPGQPGGGRGNQTPAPPIDDVLNKYLDAIGGQAALAKIQSRVMTGTVVTRAGQSQAFTISEKGNKYLEVIQQSGGASAFGYDGAAGWSNAGGQTADVKDFPLQDALVLNDLPRFLQIKDRYQNLQAGRPTRLPSSTPGGTPIAANLIQGSPAPGVTERFYFDAESGLLLRRQVITRTPLNGSLVEVIDYSDYKAVAGVMMPFTIKRNNWDTLDTMTVTDIKPNVAIDDGKFAKPRG
jgi:hypothetical protein